MAYNYPYGNGQQLNLDWFLEEWKNLLAAWEAEKNGIEGALQAEIDRAEAALADVFAARDAAAQSAANALESKNATAQSAQDASGYLATVRADANTASNAARNAAQSESNAADSAQTALASKNNAANSERNAAQSEQNALGYKNDAAQSAEDAQTAEQNVQDTIENATTQAVATATQSANDAAQRAGNSASAAAQSEQNALGYKNEAAQSAEDAEDAAASVEASTQQIATNTSDIADLKESVNTLTASSIENTASGNPVFFTDGADDVSIKEAIINILYTQSGAGQVSPSNPHPITGYNRLSFIHGDNQYYNANDVTLGFYLNNDGDEVASGGWMYTGFIPVENSIVYGGLESAGINPYSAWYDANKNLLSTFKQQGGIRALSVPQNAKYVRFSLTTSDRNKFFVTKGDIIERNFQQTKYGGSLNLTSGILKTDRLIAELPTLTYETLYTGNTKIALRGRVAQNYSSLAATFNLSNFTATQHPIIGSVTNASAFANPDEFEDGIYLYRSADIAETTAIYYVGLIGTTPSGY